MREIRFRAWDKDDKAMRSWEELILEKEDGDDYWMVGYKENKVVTRYDHKQILMQYTGLKDKNGTEIYEGDVVKGSYYAGYNIGIKRIIGSVGWASASFKVNGVKQYEGTIVGLDGSFEVIGNIYENPELLERK